MGIPPCRCAVRVESLVVQNDGPVERRHLAVEVIGVDDGEGSLNFMPCSTSACVVLEGFSRPSGRVKPAGRSFKS